MHIRLVCAVLSLAASVPVMADQATQKVVEKPAALIADGIPAVPQSLADSTRAYMEYRTATFQSWNPKDRSVLITTRF